MLKKISYLVLITLFISCNSSDDKPDCSAVLCAEPSILINLIDTETNKNMVSQNSISKENILIQNETETLLEFNIIESTGVLYIAKSTSAGTLEIKINAETAAIISYDTTTPETDECCDYGTLTNIEVTDKTFDLDNNTISIYL